MKKGYYIFYLFLGTALLTYYFLPLSTSIHHVHVINKIRSTSSPKAGIESKKGRAEYFNRMLRDPKTKQIPYNIRQQEVEFAKELNAKNESLRKTNTAEALEWFEAGPKDVGGRTRAIVVDKMNSNTIIAGGASGGIWKSINKGLTWTMKSTTSQVLSVTSIAQDPRSGQTNTWYYASGEFDGSSADLGFTHRFSGGGIYKSTDNGETWTILQNAMDTNPLSWNTPFDFVSKIIVNPNTGSVFIASHAFGILKSNDGGNSFGIVLGGANEHIYSDIDVSSNGTLVAVISSPFQGTTASNTPGVYKSTDDGQTWTSMTPSGFPEFNLRSVIKTANNNTAYCLTFTGSFINEKYDDVRFYKLNIPNGTSEDRSANLPNFNQDFEDYLHTQNSYNMVVAVKPDNENFVMIGATSLFRSTNGFSSKPTDMKLDWIGGYNLQNFFYPNFHPDIHSFSFDPNNPNAMWWGHDGGLSYTSDVTATNYSTYFPWEDKNNGYNVTQFYMVAIPNKANDNRIVGGTQDNGSPFFRFDGSNISTSDDLSTGDGSYAYFGDTYCYASAQNGAILQLVYDNQGNPSRNNGWSNITPKDATNQTFIHPYVVDPNNENIMLYPAGNLLWRNNQLNSLPSNPTFAEGITTGWTKLDNIAAPSTYVISALAITQSNPSSRLYFAAVDYAQNPGAPKIYKLDNAATATSGAVEISINGLDPYSYIHNIAVNPDNGNELIVVLSNYNVMGLYHSTNGGQTFTGIEGNLEGGEGNPGPSIRAASILPTSNGTMYFLATSTGVYSTSQINGGSTTWSQEGANTLGNVIVNYITSRKSDGRVVAGTHGRGAFIANASSSGTAVANVNVSSLTLQSKPGQTGSTSFVLKNDGNGTLNYNISVTGTFNGSLNKFNSANNVLRRADPNSKEFEIFRKKSNFNKTSKIAQSVESKKSDNLNTLSKRLGNDYLYLDDGNTTADSFLGWGDGSDFDWYNEFNVSGFDFVMDSFEFFVRSESASSNEIYAAIYDQNTNLLAEGFLSLNTSTEGQWFTIPLDPVLSFSDGETFFIELYSYSGIPYPAGADYDATVPNKGYYFNGTSWVNINTITGFENGAFLIGAIGTKSGGGGNQNPNAVATISKTQAEVNETITFDASQSNDTDGQITSYSWNFGDGTTSTDKIATHAYSSANTYTYSLTVTDNDGATGHATGQITVSGTTTQYVTVSPASGSIPAGGSQNITLTLNAQTLQEGTYTGQVSVNTNGGNFTIPIDYLVNVEKLNSVPTEYSLSQNYPNPFNPTTSIEFSVPEAENVRIKIYDMLGKEVTKLLDEKKSPGKYRVTFDASSLASGTYIYRIETPSFVESKKMILLK